MSKRLLVTAALLWAFSITAPVRAQQFTMNMSSPQFPLLMSKPVQKELNLTDDQNKKIAAKVQELMPEGSPIKFGGDGKAAGDGAPKINFVIGAPKTGGAPPVAGGTVAIDPSTFR